MRVSICLQAVQNLPDAHAIDIDLGAQFGL